MKNKLKRQKENILVFLIENRALWLTVVLCAIVSLSTPLFLSQSNLINVLRQVCVTSIVAVGFTMVIGSGHIDLSVGSMLGLLGMVMGMLMRAGFSTGIAILGGVLIGVVCSSVNASFITFFSLPPFIVTLATQQVFRGITYLLTNRASIMGLPEDFLFLGQGYIGKIPMPIYILAGVILIMFFVVKYTVFGRYAVAMGGNQEAVRISGVNIAKIRFGVYITVGICVGIAAAVMTARVGAAQVSAGQDLEMDSIAAVVIGGTAMSGGSCKIIGTLFGCILVGVINNALNLLGVNASWQIIAKGAIILISILLDTVSRNIYAALRNKAAME